MTTKQELEALLAAWNEGKVKPTRAELDALYDAELIDGFDYSQAQGIPLTADGYRRRYMAARGKDPYGNPLKEDLKTD